MSVKYAILFVLTFILFQPLAAAQDCWLSVSGNGNQSGESAAHALPAFKAQQCWEETSAGGTLHVMEGNYEGPSFWRLTINKYPEMAPQFKTLRGEGKVRLLGPRPIPYSKETAGQGGTWLEIKRGAAFLRIENFQISQVEIGILAAEGENHDLEIQDLDFLDTRQNIVISGHPGCRSLQNCRPDPAERSQKILIERVNGKRYSKRHIRLGQGISQVRVTDSHADAERLDGDFAVGFDVENPAWDIEFRDSSSRGNLFSESEYWNGDGFKSEDQTFQIRWTGCSAFENADAGFDIKSENAQLENITAARNNRNIRIWKSAVMKHIRASESRSLGGNGSQAGIWSQGPYECHFCVVKNNRIQVSGEDSGKPYLIRFYDSTLSLDATHPGELVLLENSVKAEWNRTTLSRPQAA